MDAALLWKSTNMFKTLKKIIKPTKVFSYGQFLLDNPNATRKERQEAVKRFLDSVWPDASKPPDKCTVIKSK